VITTHIFARALPGQPAHEQFEHCWCRPTITRFGRGDRPGGDLVATQDHTIVDHRGGSSAGTASDVTTDLHALPRTGTRQPSHREGPAMTAQFRTAQPEAELRRRVEQAIARRWPVLRTMTELDISYEQYRDVRDRLDELSRQDDEIPLRRAG
jgi:hypothetical protein